MSKQIIQDAIWHDRLVGAERYYKEWETRFLCNILDQYYEGFQWKSQEQMWIKPYVINKIYETIQIKIAQFIPTFPQYMVSSRVGNENDLAKAASSAQLKEDLLNTVVQDPNVNFSEEFEQAYKDSFFRFGMIEVGYAADWVLNPNAQKPLLGKDTDTNLNETKRQRVVDAPTELPKNERIYVKHIPARCFRIGGLDHKYLNRCGWAGYYEFINRDEILSMRGIINKDRISGVDVPVDRDAINSYDPNKQPAGTLKVWHIWDLRANVQLLIVDEPTVTIFERKFKRFPLFDLRPNPRLIVNGFYPIPPAFHWLSPQDEYNETREMLRNHRRRFVRKFQCIVGTVDDDEIEKFETGPDGALIKVARENAITPVQNAELGKALDESVQLSADDLNRISGTSDESRGVADRTTATQATIVNQRTALRETKERDRVVKWFCLAGREILLTIGEKFTGDVVVKLTSPEGETFLGSVNPDSPKYRKVNVAEIDDNYDFRIDVDLTSMSSAAQEMEKKHLVEFLTLLTQFPMVAFSPYLIREIAYRVGYRNEKAIAEFQQMALLMELARMQQLQAAAGQGQQQQQGMPLPENGNAGQQLAAQMAPPDIEALRNQMTKQVPAGMLQQ